MPNQEHEQSLNVWLREVTEHEQSKEKQVYDVHKKNLGYDVTTWT